MNEKNDAMKRDWKRVECEFFGVLIPYWAWAKPSGANVKRPCKGRTKQRRLTAEEREDRRTIDTYKKKGNE